MTRDEKNAIEKARYWTKREAVLAQTKARYEADPDKYRALSRSRRRNHVAEELLCRAKRRAKSKGWEFNLNIEDIHIPVECPVLRIPLVVGVGKSSYASPSLDRIDNRKGYVKGNVRVISHRANTLKSNGSLAELRAVYEDAVRLAQETTE